MTQEDQRRRRADAEALLRLPRWNDEEIDHAVALHDLLLESPDGESDRVAAALRKRLTLALRQRSRDIIDLTRAQYFAAGWLDSPDPFQRRLSDLHYLGLSSYLGLQAGVPGLLDRAIGFLLELDRVVQESGTTARDLLGERYDTAMINLAAACYLRYDGRRELLVLQPPHWVARSIAVGRWTSTAAEKPSRYAWRALSRSSGLRVCIHRWSRAVAMVSAPPAALYSGRNACASALMAVSSSMAVSTSRRVSRASNAPATLSVSPIRLAISAGLLPVPARSTAC